MADNKLVTEVDKGYEYELTNVGKGTQTLTFIKKELAEEAPEGELETVLDGTTNEAVLEVLIMRLQHLDTLMRSPFNTKAIEHLECALGALKNRTADRQKRGVEGTQRE